jgi:large subunit ribosomal protein L21
MKFAVIQTGGKQYRVAEGDRLQIEKLETEEGGEVRFNNVLLLADGERVSVGKPTVSGAVVTGKILKQDRHDKVIVFRYHSKTRQRKKKGHRQPFTEVEITGIR